MIDDPIVAELHRYREAHAACYDNDLRKICAALKRLEQDYPVVNLQPRPLKSTQRSKVESA